MARGASTAAERGCTNWRIKDRGRFGDPELVAVCYETGCREVFDYHETICDLIDAARTNEITVSLLTLARIVHDDAGFMEPAWFEPRRQMLCALRDLEKPLIEFQGDVTSVHQQLTIRLPEETYVKWHTDGGAKSVAAKQRPRTENGRFVSTKYPQMQAVDGCGDHNCVVEPQAPLGHDTTRHDKEGLHGPAAPTPLPAILEVECERAAAATRMNLEWWITNIQKLRQRNLSASDDVFIAAIDWVLSELDGTNPGPQRGWKLIRGAVENQIKWAKAQPAVATADDHSAMYAKLGKPSAA